MLFNEKDKILKKVEKPTRYTGQELNMCIKDAVMYFAYNWS